MNRPQNIRDRMLGCLYGQAIGDALGLGTEFMSKQEVRDTLLSYEEIREIGEQYDERIAEWIDLAYTSPDISSLNLYHSESIGYTLRTLSAALW